MNSSHMKHNNKLLIKEAVIEILFLLKGKAI